MATKEATQSTSNGVITKEAWAGRAVHEITLVTGAKVKVKLPDLSRLIRNNLLPEHLRTVALRQAFNDMEIESEPSEPVDEKKRDAERLETARELVELLDALIVDMMVEPVLTLEDLSDIPGEDRDLLVAIAQRERDTDALGVRLGVAPLSTFEGFREFHKCGEDCEACNALQDRFSTSRHR